MKTLKLLLSVFFLLLAACAAENLNELSPEPASLAETATALPTATTIPANTTTPQPTATATLMPIPTATFAPTATPTPAYNLFPGMIFSQDNITLRVDANGALQTIFDQPDTYILSFSPDGRYLIYTDFNDNLLYLRDLVQGENKPIFSEPLADVRLSSWWTVEPEWALLSVAPTLAYVNAWFGGGLPTLINLDGSSAPTLLIPESDPAVQQFTDAAVSPTGGQLAFDIGGEGWLYDFELGARPFDPADYGLTQLGEAKLSLRNPLFSPNGRFLAWQIKEYQLWPGYEPDRFEFGVAVFDLVDGTAVVIPNLILSAVDHNYIPPMRWVDNEQLLINAIMFPDGAPETAGPEAWNYRNAVVHWPTGSVHIFVDKEIVEPLTSETFLLIRRLVQDANSQANIGELIIENLAGSSEQLIGVVDLSQRRFQSPDGRSILFGDQLFDLDSQSLQPVTLPTEYQLVTWTAVP